MSTVERRRPLERYLPVSYFVAALALVVVLMPTILRPPPQTPPQAAEFSPDAPPDPQQDSIVASFQRGQSGTAGSGQAALGGGTTAAGAAGVTTTIPPVKRSRSCAFGYGNPPRQTESIYSPPCAASFVGDNGGATTKGVFPTEVRIGISPQTGGYRPSYDGPIKTEPDASETPADRTWRVFQAYFNSRYELYGRQLRLYAYRGGSTGNAAEGKERAVALDADQVFAIIGNNGEMEQEAMRRKIVSWGTYHNDADFYANNAPYAYSWYPEGDNALRLTGEVLCKQLAGKPASFTNDPRLSTVTRRFGLIAFQDSTHTHAADKLNAALAKCGESLAQSVDYLPDPSDETAGTAGYASAVTQLRAANVSTIVCFCDYFFAPGFMSGASSQSYFPEWFVPGIGNLDQNAKAKSYPPEQWSHAFGFSYQELPRPDPETDWYRAYRQIDPSSSPNRDVGENQFLTLAAVVAGIQMAGPQLTPETYREGLLRLPHHPPDPIWAVAGGYAPDDLTFADYVGFMWWSPTASDPQQSSPGAYLSTYGGKKFKLGEVPTDPIPWFKEGVSRPPPGTG